MAEAGESGRRAGRRGKAARPAQAHAEPSKQGTTQETTDEFTLLSLARELRSWADSVLGIAGTAADLSLNVAKSILPKREHRAALEKTGSLLRGMREAAGLSLKELGEAVNLRDPALLEAVEGGKAALPFEIILRLAAVLGRNDPISFVMRLTRTYNPDLWKTLENLGIGRLVLQAGREREFANIYRSDDEARRLTDDEFAAVLAFTKSAFEAAMSLRAHGDKPRPGRAGKTGKG